MNNVIEIKGFSWPRIIFDQKNDGVSHHSKEVQEIISQKIMEGQTEQLLDGLDMFERDNLISGKVFEK